MTGTPYKLMWTYTTADEAENNTNVAAIEKGVDARGGINGHPLQIVLCADNNDANQATQCARNAVADPNTLGLISNASTCSSQVLPILARAHMASINDDFFCPEDFKSPQVFPFSGGTLANVAGAVLGITLFKDPNTDVVTVDLPAGHELPPLVQSIVSPAGGKVTSTVYIPYTAADLASYAAQIAAHPAVLYEGLTVALGIRLGQAFKDIGYNQPVLYNPVTWDPSIIKSQLGNPTNAYLAEFYDESSAGWKTFTSDMNQYAPGVTYQGLDLVDAWLGANVVAEIAKSLPSVSASSVSSYLATATNLNTFGMTPPLNFTVPQKAMGGLIPRAVEDQVALYHAINGTAVQVTPFRNDVLP